MSIERAAIFVIKLCGRILVRRASGRSNGRAIRARPVLRSRSTTRLSVSPFHPRGDAPAEDEAEAGEEETRKKRKSAEKKSGSEVSVPRTSYRREGMLLLCREERLHRRKEVGGGGCGGMIGGVVEPTAGRGREGEGAKGRRPEWREDRRRNDKGKGRRASGATARGRGEAKGVVAAEALEGRRSQCTAGECNARAARRAKQY